MRLFLRTFVAVLMFAPSAAHALDFQIHPNAASMPQVTAVLATGDIKDDDTGRLSEFLSAQPRRNRTAIYLASPGGSLAEGMRLGRFFKVAHVKTVVEGGEICASACALAFLGGTDNDGNPWRSSSTNSRLGFHEFSTPGARMQDENETQKIVSQVLQYGKEVDAPLDILIANFATPSDNIYWLSQTEICALGIKLWDTTNNRFVC